MDRSVVLGTLQACGALMAFLGASLHHDVVVTRPSIQSFGIAPVHGGWAVSLGGTF